MSLRRYVNIATANHHQGIYSLRRLNADNFFYPANEAAAKARDLLRLRRVPADALSPWFARKKKKHVADKQLETPIRPPQPIFSVRPTTCPPMTDGYYYNRLHSFPLSGTKIFFFDSARRTTLYDTKARCSISTPCLHAHKDFPVAFSVPSPAAAGPGGEQDQDGGSSSSLYILDTALDPANATPFEALIWRHFTDGDYKAWHCDALPRPPFADRQRDLDVSVLCYAVVGDAICVSLRSLGTYCFDTVSRTWSPAGDWLMPFSGKAEYDPELKLWFGVSAGNHQLPCPVRG